MLPQALGLAPDLTVAENVALPLRLGGSRDDIGERVAELLEIFGVGGLSGRYPGEVSFGPQQLGGVILVAAPNP
ncbi:hypothetical protein [Amycolatopsis acididurans]|uniref:hypothetical protein n=1 Tax=Amycolatopsis acididurans TaxID=2724524 RepID=UPI0035E40623